VRLDMHSRQEIYKASWREYRKAGKKERGEILDRLVLITGINRDYLATRLRNYGKDDRDGAAASCGKAVKGKRKERADGKRGGRPQVYGERFAGVLEAIWRQHGRMCGKLLVPTIREIIDFLVESKDPDYGIDGAIRALLLSVSPAEIFPILRRTFPVLRKTFSNQKKTFAGLSQNSRNRVETASTWAGNGLGRDLGCRLKRTSRAAGASIGADRQGKGEAGGRPVRPSPPCAPRCWFGHTRKTVTPGHFAFDTAAHCGSAASGQFCKPLTGTDVYSGRVGERPLQNAANRRVQAAFPDTEG
jgi:hypothetical protein